MNINYLREKLKERVPDACQDGVPGSMVAGSPPQAEKNIICITQDDGSLDCALQFHSPLPASADQITSEDRKSLEEWRRWARGETGCGVEIAAFYLSYHFTSAEWGIFYNHAVVRRIALDIMDFSMRDPLLQYVIDNPGQSAREIAHGLYHPEAKQQLVFGRLQQCVAAQQVTVCPGNTGNIYRPAPGISAERARTKWIGPIEAAKFAYALLRLHELFHFKFDLHATMAELTNHVPLYIRYVRGIYKSEWPKGHCYEESLANLQKISQSPQAVKAFARDWAKNSASGYSGWSRSPKMMWSNLEAQLFGAWDCQTKVSPRAATGCMEGEVDLGFNCPEYMVMKAPADHDFCSKRMFRISSQGLEQAQQWRYFIDGERIGKRYDLRHNLRHINMNRLKAGQAILSPEELEGYRREQYLLWLQQT